MSKPPCKSTFTLTFAIEIVGFEIWHDCNEGFVDLGPIQHGARIQYQLSPGYSFDVDIAIWPHAAKVVCGQESCWVRTWQYLERRWLTFSITHAVPVRVVDFQIFEVCITPNIGVNSIGSGAKSDNPPTLYIPHLAFGERRYFGPVHPAANNNVQVDTDRNFIAKLIWKLIVDYIPASYLDGPFDVPNPVKDVRHQDAILYHVQDRILNGNDKGSYDINFESSHRMFKDKGGKEMKKKKPEGKPKFEIKLSGDTILAAAGRIIPLEVFGELPDTGEIIVLISSCNLPAPDDLPIVFVNVCKLFDAPWEELLKLNISHLYTRWFLGNEIRDSAIIDIRRKTAAKEINFNDHHAIPLEPGIITQITAFFLDDLYEIQLRGMRDSTIIIEQPKLFGYEKGDRDYGIGLPPKIIEEELDFVIAVTRIDARNLTEGISQLVSGEFPLYPLRQIVRPLSRVATCTNDINQIGAPLVPKLIVPTSVILASQMTLEVTMGVVGCRPPRLSNSFSRLYCIVSDSECTTAILLKMWEINEEWAETTNDMLTGFALDTGDVMVLYIEGPRDGYILHIWNLTEELEPKVKPVFSTSARYARRIYSGFIYRTLKLHFILPELLQAVPFIVLKMHVPLGTVLACPPVYARPALPLPARIAALKIGRLIQNRLRTAPPSEELPTPSELKSFRLELCAAPRMYHCNPQQPTNEPVLVTSANKRENEKETSIQPACETRINWTSETH